MQEKTHVAIVGLGTVGTGVARLLLDHGDRTARHAGRVLWLSHVVVRDVSRPRNVDLPEGLLTSDLNRLLEDRRVEVVAQLIGGIEPARTIMLQLLESGKDVVTANKALLAEHGPELFDRARQLGRSIAFEASVAGGIPIVANISQHLSANQITSLRGILNGTTNFIVSQMDRRGWDFDRALDEAQKLGYAEADPTLDIDATDATQKLAILSHLAFGSRAHWKDIPRRGIGNLQQVDLEFASRLGYRIKLIAYAELTDVGLQLAVGPMLVEKGRPLAEVQENYNAVSVVGDAVGPVFFHGQGAGQMPTASAVVADMIDMAVGRTALTFKTLELWSDESSRTRMADPSQAVWPFYLRFQVVDRPGVLGQIAGCLGENGVSIASVYQPRTHRADGDVVPIVIMTHPARSAAVTQSIRQIESRAFHQGATEQLPILDPSTA